MNEATTEVHRESKSKPARRRRTSRRQLTCPCHINEQLTSISPKHNLYITDVETLALRGISKSVAEAVLAEHRHVVHISDEWLEGFWCRACAEVRWWHVIRSGQHCYQLKPIAHGLWEQVSGVVRPEGNPSVGQFSREQSRAAGVHGLKQYQFL